MNGTVILTKEHNDNSKNPSRRGDNMEHQLVVLFAIAMASIIVPITTIAMLKARSNNNVTE